MTELRLTLRAATHASHAKLEAVFALDPANLTRQRYGRALQVLHSVRAGWEPVLAKHLPEWLGPHRTWLESDLGILGLCPLPPAPRLAITSDSEAWGASYVLEGSALGGQSILRALTPLNVTPECGARYFAGRGKQTGPHWLDFLGRLDAQASPTSVPQIVAGAQTAFEALYREAFRTPPGH